MNPLEEALLEAGFCDAEQLRRDDVIEAVAARGIAVGHVPAPDRDGDVIGIDGDRAKWTPEARAVYDGFDDVLAKRYAASCDPRGITARTVLTPLAGPTSLWQRLKLALRERWPRVFGWLKARTR